MDGLNMSANAIYSAFKNCLQEFEIPITNIIGVACDGASVMVGINNSFFKLLLVDVPHAILLRCICHSAALVVSNACVALPRSPEEVLRGVYNYVSGSAKRCAQLQELQQYFRVEEHKILKLATTRWLSRHQCIVRILEQWEVLESYFRVAVYEDSLKCAELILNELQNICTKAYLTFLKYILHIFNYFNGLFQSKKILIHILYSETYKLVQLLCKNYIDLAVVQEIDLLELNLANPTIFLPHEKINVGPECSELLFKMPKEGKNIFLINIQKFYVAAAVDLQKRMPDSLFKCFSILNPDIAFSMHTEVRNININALCNKLQVLISLDKTQVAIEWNMLPESFSKFEIDHFKNMNIDEMWLVISNKKRYDDTRAFENLGKLAKFILTLPHSNAEAERIVSIVTDTKTKKRNRLGETCLNAISVTRSALQSAGITTHQYKVTKELLNCIILTCILLNNENVKVLHNVILPYKPIVINK